MTNKQIVKAFANGATKGAANSMFIEGNTIYSWGRHFPLAIRNYNGLYIVNKDKYSRSTSRHQSALRGALAQAGHTLYVEVSTEEIIKLV